MNERIRELALEAGIGFTLWDDSGREMIDNYTPEEQLEKFAELIVKECISIAEAGLAPAVATVIKERFGYE